MLPISWATPLIKKQCSNRKQHAHGQFVLLGGLLYVMQINYRIYALSHRFPRNEYNYLPNCTLEGNHKCRIECDIDVTGRNTALQGQLTIISVKTSKTNPFVQTYERVIWFETFCIRKRCSQSLDTTRSYKTSCWALYFSASLLPSFRSILDSGKAIHPALNLF